MRVATTIISTAGDNIIIVVEPLPLGMTIIQVLFNYYYYVNKILPQAKRNLSFLKKDSSTSVLLNSIFQSACQISSFPPAGKQQFHKLKFTCTEQNLYLIFFFTALSI